MTVQQFKALMPSDLVRQKITQIDIICKPAKGLRVDYANINGGQLRIKAVGTGKDQVIFTMIYQTGNKMFFCRSYAQPNVLIRLGLKEVVVPNSQSEPLKSEFYLTETEFEQYIFAIVEAIAKSKSVTVQFF